MIVVVLHEPQELVNIAHVVRALKNFGLRDLRLVDPREYDAHRRGVAARKCQGRFRSLERSDRVFQLRVRR
jgi:tRNA C32,U32 (ribose-2'-O)-methylase TrmJ